MRFAVRAIGYLVSALGLGVAIFGLLALADPQGAQLANDSDPFGAPPQTGMLLLHIAAGVALMALGIWLVARKPQV